MANTNLDTDTNIEREDINNGGEMKFQPLEEYRIKELPEAAYYIPNFLTPAESATLLAAIAKQPWTTLTHRRLQPHPAPLTPAGHLLTTKALPPFLKPVIDRLLELSFADTVDEPTTAGDGHTNHPISATIPLNDQHTNLTTKSTKWRGIFTSSPHGAPNHVLINEYPPGTGISPHEDGGAYYPVVCTVSLGSHTVLEITPKTSHTSSTNEHSNVEESTGGYRIFQEPLSLLITTGSLYTSHLHGIAPVKVDENLTAATVVNWPLLAEGTRREIEGGGGVVQRREVRVSLTCRDVLKVRDAGWVFGGKRR
ncbi:hypothetical protein TWF696_003204 [Orbilia brochopaga]|uniref:Fe2OG dioxygenase domain-containing protein n=1 Tax=Orbilia brochopaga TaxID=3140254 RepID=A0AAV9TZD4_9PEZI